MLINLNTLKEKLDMKYSALVAALLALTLTACGEKAPAPAAAPAAAAPAATSAPAATEPAAPAAADAMKK